MFITDPTMGMVKMPAVVARLLFRARRKGEVPVMEDGSSDSS